MLALSRRANEGKRFLLLFYADLKLIPGALLTTKLQNMLLMEEYAADSEQFDNVIC